MNFFRGTQSFQNSDSNAQVKVFMEVQRRGLNVLLNTDLWIRLDEEADGVPATKPDFYWSPPYRYACYLDGDVHLGKTSSRRDGLIDAALARRSIHVDRFPYHPPLSNTLCRGIADRMERVLAGMGHAPFNG